MIEPVLEPFATRDADADAVLSVRDLRVTFPSEAGRVLSRRTGPRRIC